MWFLFSTCDFTLFQFNFSPLSISSSFFLLFLFDFYVFNSIFSFLNQVFPISIASLSRFYSFPVPIFTSLSSFPPKVSPGFYSSPVSIIFYLSFSPRLRFLFYSISTLSLSLQFFTCDSSSSPPAISFYLLPFKTITMPEIPSTFLSFHSIYPRFNLSIRFVFHPFERSFAWKNLKNAKNSPEIMQIDNPNSRQNPMILCFTT